MTEQFANFAQGVLAAPITAKQTTISITPTDYTGRPGASKFPSIGTFHIVVQSFDVTTQIPTSAPEIMVVTAVSHNTFTVTRGAESTAAIAFASGAQVVLVNTAGVMQALASGGAVTSFNTRTGAVVPLSDDYASFYVPYSGATGNVNLGSWDLIANAVGTDELIDVMSGNPYLLFGGSGQVKIGDIEGSGYQYQINQSGDPAGHYWAAPDASYMNFSNDFLAINGDSIFGQIMLSNYPATDPYAAIGIGSSDNPLISGSTPGDLNILTQSGGNINFSTNFGTTNNMSLSNESGGLTIIDNEGSTLGVGGGTAAAFAVQPGSGINTASFSNYGASQNVGIFNGTSALQINDGTASSGYVWTATDGFGNGQWEANSGATQYWSEQNPFSATYAYLKPANADRLIIDPTNTISDDTYSTLQVYNGILSTDQYGSTVGVGGGSAAALYVSGGSGIEAGSFSDTNGNQISIANGGQALYAENVNSAYVAQLVTGGSAASFNDNSSNDVTIANNSVGILATNGSLSATLIDSGYESAAVFANGSYTAYFGYGYAPAAGYLTDGTTTTTLNDGTNAVTAFGNIDATSYSVSGTAGISGTMTTSSLVGKTLTFNNGLITGFA